jgi:hypothetical protein
MVSFPTSSTRMFRVSPVATLNVTEAPSGVHLPLAAAAAQSILSLSILALAVAPQALGRSTPRGNEPSHALDFLPQVVGEGP